MQESEHRPTARVLDILELLAANADGLTLTEIAASIGAPKSSIFPLIRTMTQRKFIFGNQNSSKYRIGIAAYVVGSSYTNNMTTLQFIHSEMKQITTKCGESCQLGVLDKNMVLYIAKVESEAPIRLASYVGKRLPPYCSAIGKSLLSDKSIEEIKSWYPDGLKAYTPNTITDFSRLEKELAQIRTSGIAKEQAEIAEHIYCMSIPLRKDDKIVTALSISYPDFRAEKGKEDLMRSCLTDAKTKIETYFRDHDVNIEELTFGS